jgi:hypothetical protein
MSRYRRPKIEGGAFFFTLALADRAPRRGDKIAPERVGSREEA